jgi:hypothetical protein
MNGTTTTGRLAHWRSRRGLVGVALLLVACTGPGSTAPALSPAATTAVVSTTVGPTQAATTAPTATPGPTPLPSFLTVSAISNIFGAGRTTPPGPGGGGSGGLPPEWPLPAGDRRIVTFPLVTGEVYGRVGQAPANGPEGETNVGTDVTSWDGISGIVDGNRAMFLVGVFLTDDPPADPAPRRLDFTDNDFDLLKPAIGQTFLIGDGVERRYLAPRGATRLFLGFAEGMFYVGEPGWYSNNSGALEVKIEVNVD